jgi:cellulose synthase/poly-beta-1,6-N-acetylglucosamine synthase-like glycosyltransferase
MAQWALFVSLAALAYCYAGYPALAWIMARLRRREPARAPLEPRVAIVIAAYNEAGGIGRKLENCTALDYPRDRLRIVVASDGSIDGTAGAVARFGDERVTLLAFPHRRGKAACLNDAVAACDEEIIVFTDVRQRIDPQAVRRLAENFADPAVGAASGELVFETDGITGFGEGMDAYWRYEKFLRRQESLWHSVVGATGALYALRRECFRAIPPDTILDDVLIPMNVVMSGRRVVFDGRARAYDRPAQSARRERLRKVRTLAGNWQLIVDHPRLFVPFRDPLFLQIASHKALRLAGPLLMAVLLVSNIALAAHGVAYAVLLALQLAGYAAGVRGALPLRRRASRAARIASAFLVLNAFAVLGFAEYLRNRSAHLWRSDLAPPEKARET